MSDHSALDAALVRQFAARQNVGAIATFIVTIAIAFVIASHVPSTILISWTAAQIFVALSTVVRWNRVRHLEEFAANARALINEAVVWKAVAGVLWGTLAAVSNYYLPQSLQFFIAIAVAAVAIGGITTLSAIPAAMYIFILFSFTPFIGFWLTSSNSASVTLGVLSILLLAVIINSARIAHRQVFSVLQNELELRRLTEQFEAERSEWLELSDTAESYVVFDNRDRLVAWNKRYAELMEIPPELLRRGTSRGELIRAARQAVDVASGSVPIDLWLELRTDRTNNEEEETAITEFEGGLWVQRRKRYSKNGNQVVSHVDVTDLVKLEAALRENEERYRLIAENSPDSIFVRVGEEIVYANPAAAKMLGADSEADLLGMSIMSLYHPSDQPLVVKNRSKLTDESGESPAFIRARMRRLDGTYVVTAGGGRSHTWEGKPAVLVTRRDITPQIEAEERLRESEGRYRRIADLSPIAIVVRIDDIIVFANPAAVQMFGGESEADLLYESALSLIHPDDQHLVTNNRATMDQDSNDPAPTIRVRRRRLDGSYFDCEGSGAPFTWQGKQAVLVMWRDITAEPKTEQRERLSA